MESILATKEEVSKMQPLKIKPPTKLMEKELRIIQSEVGIEPLVVEQVKTIKTIMEETDA